MIQNFNNDNLKMLPYAATPVESPFIFWKSKFNLANLIEA